jgi:hypothetical protein
MQSTFCLLENISSTEIKWNGTQPSDTMHMHLEDDIDKAGENWKSYPH